MPFADIGTSKRLAMSQGRILRFTCTDCGQQFTRSYDVTHYGRRTRIYCSPACLASAQHKRYVAATESRFWAKVDRRGPDDCWEWKGYRNPRGYGRASSVLFKTKQAHRIAYAFSKGALPAHLHACHSCDNPPCCNPAHLFPGTDAENGADRQAKGRSKYAPVIGSAHPKSKLTPEQVLEAFFSSEPDRAVADRFGVATAAIWRIRHGRSWAHLTGARHA